MLLSPIARRKPSALYFLLIAEDARREELEPDSLFPFGLLSLLDVMVDVGMVQLPPTLSLQEPLAQGC